jgi:TPR repeat protein
MSASVDIGALLKKSDAGNAAAQNSLARLYFDGSGGASKNEKEAVALWVKSSTNGNAEGKQNRFCPS